MNTSFKKILKKTVKIFVFAIVLMALCAIIYPMALTGVSQLTMEEKADGSLITADGEYTTDSEKAVGSALIGQEFTDNRFFQGRVSSVDYNTYTEKQKENGEYEGAASGSFNYGNSNPELEKRIKADTEEFLKNHPDVKKEDIPAELLTASGSGLDPHISPEAAEIQIKTVAENTGLSVKEVEQIVKDNTKEKVLGIFGEETVNVLKCNLEIANKIGLI